MGTKTGLRWNLRQVMTERGLFKTSDLVEPLRERGIDLSRQMIHRVVSTPPQRINIELLAALCDILGCTPNDLLELHVAHEQAPRAAVSGGANIGDLRPRRATVRRPEGV